MRLARLACLLVSLLAANYAQATWTLVQWKGTTCTNTLQTCAVTTTATVAGHVLIVVMGMNGLNDLPTSVTDNGTGGPSTYTFPSGCSAYESVSTFGANCAYTLNCVSGITSVTAQRGTTTSVGWQVRVGEFSSTVTTLALDAVGSLLVTTATTAPVGPALTLTGTNDIVVQFIRSSPTAVAAPYTYLTGFGVTAIGYLLNSSSAPAPTWTTSSARAAAGAIAISEGGIHQPRVDVITKNTFPK